MPDVPHRYEDGPTTCKPAKSVLNDIRRSIKRARALSAADIRLAAHMGLVAADVERRTGFNDGVFYPPEDVRAGKCEMELEIATRLHVPKQVVDGLLGDLEQFCELTWPPAFGGRVSEHPDVEAAEVVEPGGRHVGVDLFEHPEVNDAQSRADERGSGLSHT